jgi:hypothetical protein
MKNHVPTETHPQFNDSGSITNYRETKKIIETFHSRMEKYAKYLSLEGSIFLCLEIINSSQTPVTININQLPVEDQAIIKELGNDKTKFASLFTNTSANFIYVEMDTCKDFKFKFNGSDEEYFLFNSTIHPKPSNIVSEVPIRNDGNTISIGGKINLNKNDVQKMSGIEKEIEYEVEQPSRKPVSCGKNAYEIRESLLDHSIRILSMSGDVGKNASDTTDKILNISNRLYDFVEKKRKY